MAKQKQLTKLDKDLLLIKVKDFEKYYPLDKRGFPLVMVEARISEKIIDINCHLIKLMEERINKTLNAIYG